MALPPRVDVTLTVLGLLFRPLNTQVKEPVLLFHVITLDFVPAVAVSFAALPALLFASTVTLGLA